MNWPSRSLRQVAQVFNGKTPSENEQRADGCPVLKIRDVDDKGQFRGHFESFVDPTFLIEYPLKVIQTGDSLILNAAHNSDYVASKIYKCEAAVVGAMATGEWMVVRPDVNTVDPDYLFYWLVCDETRQHLRSIVKGIHLYPKDVSTLELLLPPLAEQQRIAGLLRRADRLRRLRRYALEVSAGYLQAVFVEMFGDPVRNPMGWQRGKLKDLCSEIVDCPHSTPTYSETVTEYACVRSSDIQNGYLDLSTTKYVNDEEYRVRCERLVPTAGDIVYCREGARFGNAARLPTEPRVCLGQRMMLFRPKRTVATSAFIWSVLENPCIYNQALKASGGSASPHVNVADIKMFDVIVPPHAEQQVFAGVVHRHDKTRRFQIEALRQAEHLFQALLQRAFAGEQGIEHGLGE